MTVVTTVTTVIMDIMLAKPRTIRAGTVLYVAMVMAMVTALLKPMVKIIHVAMVLRGVMDTVMGIRASL